MENDNSLLYACWINDIELIKEKLVDVKPSQLKKSIQETGTPLHLAAQNQNTQAVDLLLAAGADLEQGDFLGNNAMLACIKKGKLEMARYLIEKGSNINRKGCQNRNALNQLICYSWNKSFAEYLLSKGCIINATARHKETLLESAASFNNREVISFLLSNGIDSSSMNKALCWAIIYNSVDAVRCLLENGADLEDMYTNCKGIERSLYHNILALNNRGSRMDIIKLLFGVGVDFKKTPVRAVTLGLEKTKLSPYDYAKEKLQKYPESTFIQENLSFVDMLATQNDM
ncbi:hypothetical protein UT300005_14270 [Clostridium sp. CTA-5]